MQKKIFYTEAAYLIGTFLLAAGTAFMVRANFGMGAVVAPAYVLHLKLVQFFPFFSYGMAEYTLQAALLALLMLALRSFRPTYLFSFVTAVLYGLILDGVMLLTNRLPGDSFFLRLIYYVLGMAVGTSGVSCLFRTYFPPEAYELLVRDLTAKYHWEIGKVKIIYDCASCAVAVVMSFAFFGFGRFEGIQVGTLVSAVANGLFIRFFSRWLDLRFQFCDGLKLRRFFEKIDKPV